MQKKELLNVLLKEYDDRYEKYADWVKQGFEEIVNNDELEYILNQALLETATRNYINKHGVEHGLNVARYLLRLFELIDEGIVSSDFKEDFSPPPGAEEKVDENHVLFALLVAGYIHDVGRFYNPTIHHAIEIGDAIDIIDKLRQPPGPKILSGIPPSLQGEIIRRIKELCLCHDQKDKPSDSVEIALIKLADALDCAKTRTYYSEKESKFREKTYSEQLKAIFFNDKHPDKYFGCSAVNKVSVDWDPNEAYLDIKLDIQNWAASVPIKTILEVLRFLETGGKSVRKISEAVRVWIKENGRQPYMIYPKERTLRPEIQSPKSEYIVKLDNGGNADIEMTFEVFNPRRKGDVTTQIFEFWGFNQTEWQKTAVIKMFDGRDGRELEPKHLESSDDGKKHIWSVSFRKLKPRQQMTLTGKYKWHKWANINQDEFAYLCITRCDHLLLKVIFPSEIGIERIQGWTEMIMNDKQISYRPHPPSIDATTSTPSLIAKFGPLVPNVMYKIKWKLRRAKPLKRK